MASSETTASSGSRSSAPASSWAEAAVQALASRPAASCAVRVERPSRTPYKWTTWWRKSASGPSVWGGCRICASSPRSPRCRYCQASATAGHQMRRCSAPASPCPQRGGTGRRRCRASRRPRECWHYVRQRRVRVMHRGARRVEAEPRRPRESSCRSMCCTSPGPQLRQQGSPRCGGQGHRIVRIVWGSGRGWLVGASALPLAGRL